MTDPKDDTEQGASDEDRPDEPASEPEPTEPDDE
jgi:hypothetical protein